MDVCSYHIYFFPFKWEHRFAEKEYFSDRVNLEAIRIKYNSSWVNIIEPVSAEAKVERYNEKNYFYNFVQPSLYEGTGTSPSIVKHYERIDVIKGNVSFHIRLGIKQLNHYLLNVKSIGLSLYSTGVGILMFHLENSNYPEVEDVLKINQFGRRIYPPFLDRAIGVEATKEYDLADCIFLEGLSGEPDKYSEDFSSYHAGTDWQAASYIHSLIDDLTPDIQIKPVIDDRMFVLCWYGNQEFSDKLKQDNWKDFVFGSEDWYRLLFIDTAMSSCRNDLMKRRLLHKHTYFRWQKEGRLYGITRYSGVFLCGSDWFSSVIIQQHVRTIYARIIELGLTQRASVLKFSDEVTRLSGLKEHRYSHLADEINAFYREYIRFVNQVYFREVTAQDQGIELYALLQESIGIQQQVKDLDQEIEELHNYISMLEDRVNSRNINTLTYVGSLLLIPSFIVGFFGMTIFEGKSHPDDQLWYAMIIAIILLIPAVSLMLLRTKRRIWFRGIILVIIVLILWALSLPYIFKLI